MLASRLPRHRAAATAALLAAVCVLQALDLVLTRSQRRQGSLVETNFVAAAVIDHPGALAAYKSVLTASGAAILFRLRRHRPAARASWLLLGVSVGLMAWWGVYVNYLDHCLRDPRALCAVAF